MYKRKNRTKQCKDRDGGVEKKIELRIENNTMVHIWISHNTLFHCWKAHFLEIPCFEAHNPFCHPAGSTLNSWAEVVWEIRQWGKKTHGLYACRRGSKDPYFLCNLLYFTVVKLPLRTKRAVCYPNCVPYCTFVPDRR